MRDRITDTYQPSFRQSLLLAVGYLGVFFALQYFLFAIGFLKLAPDNQNLCAWDAGLYQSIAQRGYEYKAGICTNSAFYVLFPWLWKLSHLNVAGICALNALLFSIGFAFLAKLRPASIQEQFLWLTTPSFFYCCVPYSEALFFLLATMLVLGMSKRNAWMIAGSLFLISMTRASFIFLLPALLVAELITNARREWMVTLRRYSLLYLLPSLLGCAVFVLYQYSVTGIWFIYFKMQYQYMDHRFHVPVLPFKNMNDNKAIWINYLALFTGLLALAAFIVQGCRWLFQNKIIADKLLQLSLGYLGITTAYIIFYNPAWGTNTTLLIGLHRYTLATPFFIIALHHFLKTKSFSWGRIGLLFLAANVVWLLCGSYTHIQSFLYFNFLTGIVLLYELYAGNKNGWASMLIAAINIIMQLYLMQTFIGGSVFAD